MDAEQEEYFDQIVGACIVAVHDDEESIWLHLSDGSALEFYAEAEGGFGCQIHDPEGKH